MRSKSAPAATCTCSSILQAPGGCCWNCAKTRPRASDMLLLGVDTSGPDGSLALCRAEGTGFENVDLVSLAGGTYSAQLIPQLTAMLARQNFSKLDLNGFAVASGPGSFTG